MARMLVSGDDPLYVGRRLVRFASEDVGLADPQALVQALAGVECYRMLGSPEGELGLVQACLYLATCPKSNSLYAAWGAVTAEIDKSGALPAPLHLRNAPTGLMKAIGYGKGYQYDHDAPEHFSGQRCLPPEIESRVFYTPNEFGFEREIGKRLETWDKKRKERQTDSGA
jgi:putative ATPase